MSGETWTVRDFMSRITVVTGVVTVVTIALLCVYLLALLKLPAVQWQAFGRIVVVLGVGLFAGSLIVNQKLYRPIVAWLKAEESGESTPEALRRAFRRLSALPAGLFLTGIAWWSGGGLLAAGLMRLQFESFSWFTFAVLTLAASSSGFASSIFTYYWIKRAFFDLHCHLASRIEDPGERRDLVRFMPLRRKLVLSITGITFGIVVFTMFLQAVRAGEPVERNASRIQHLYLEEAVAGIARDGVDALPEIAERARRLGIADRILIVEVASGEVLAGPSDGLHPSETLAVLSAPEGRSTHIDSPHVFAWRRVGSGDAVLVAVQDWEPLGAGLRGAGVFSVLLLGCSALLCYALARAVASDVGLATEALREAANRLADGDLRGGRILETEDEVGELARAFERMAMALRDTVGRVSEMTDRIESTAGDMASVSRSVSRGALEQGRGVQSASESVDRMNGEMSGIASAAEELSVLVEESGGTVLEMGTAGEHLDETASILSERVDEVSSSIEEMVRSVKEVGAQTETLSEAASETSESMEAMALAMRRADDTAEESASLSRRVVETADRGRVRVQQTIESMESIRLATEAAERVIFGLGARTQEIGAILDVIDDVADETNLLALNAAIIAAQAGEHGRAFSVVAEEIKELADRVLSSTKEIGDLIRTVQGESHAAVGAIEQGARSVATGVSLSTEAGASLEEITLASRESGQRIEEIAHAVREQTVAAKNVAEMMERVKSGVDTIQRASAEQDRGNEIVFRSVLAMRDVAQQLRVTTREQSRGASRLQASTEGVRGAVESIHAALQSQSGSCSSLATFLEEVSALTRASERDSERLGGATAALLHEAETLRADVQQFQT